MCEPVNLYHAAHSRIVRERGPAANYSCAACRLRPAAEWSLRNGADPDEHYGVSNGSVCAYSDDPANYDPLCRPCHRYRDGRGPAGPGPGQLVLPFDWSALDNWV